MAYLANTSRVSSLTINGVDYTTQLTSWQCSDESAYRNGCLATVGSLTLAFKSGGNSVADYGRDDFRRGSVVLLDMTHPDGTVYRHPRGHLYVLSTTFEPESLTLNVELGCRLALMKLTEQIDDLVALSPIPLDVTQRQYENVSAAFASVGQYIFHNNQGDLETGVFFDGDSTAGVADGEWISINGRTALNVASLAGTSPVPDQIKLSYQIPRGALADDESGKIDSTLTESYYFTQYPAVIYVRTGDGSLGSVSTITSVPPSAAGDSSCGNTPPPPPTSSQPIACNEGYTTQSQALFLPAYRRDRSETHYNGPAGQVGYTYQEVRGPAIEANGQYFADKFAYCRYTWAHACQPNGDCPFDGMEEMLLSYTETVNYYGEANELTQSIQDVYVSTLSGAQPSDWRSGISNGAPQDFNGDLSLTDMYRVSRVITTYRQENNANIQETETYTSVTSRGSGINNGDIDALSGIRTFERRTSTSNTTLDIAPDLVNSATTDTADRESTIYLFTGRFQQPPAESGPYISEEQVPMPLLYETESEIDDAVEAYENYIARMVKGDSLGLQIGEAMRADIVTTWRPNMPFRYHDPSSGDVMAMRMNATSWGVSPSESALVTSALWIGFSDGTVILPDNIVGDSGPDMGSGGTAPSPIVPPEIIDEDYIDSGAVAWNVDVEFSFGAQVVTYGPDGVIPILPDDLSVSAQWTTVCLVGGVVVEAGDLLAANPDGSLPEEYNGSLIVDGATVINANLFA